MFSRKYLVQGYFPIAIEKEMQAIDDWAPVKPYLLSNNLKDQFNDYQCQDWEEAQHFW